MEKLTNTCDSPISEQWTVMNDQQTGREAYRDRLYRHYISTLSRPELSDVQVRLRAAYPYFRRLLKLLPKDKASQILDIGCGSGSNLHWLKAEGYQGLEGVDRSPEQVATAHRLGLGCVHEADIATHLATSKTNRYDVVIAFDVLEHFSKDEALRIIDEVFRVLTPNGLLVMHLPNGEGLFGSRVVYGDFTHEMTVTGTSLRQLLRCAGFVDIQSYEDVPVVHGPVSAMRYLAWKLIRTLLRIAYASETGDTGRDMIFTQCFLAAARKPINVRS